MKTPGALSGFQRFRLLLFIRCNDPIHTGYLIFGVSVGEMGIRCKLLCDDVAPHHFLNNALAASLLDEMSYPRMTEDMWRYMLLYSRSMTIFDNCFATPRYWSD